MSFNSDQVQVQFPERKRVFTFARARGAQYDVLVSIVVSIPACHAGGRGSIPRQGVFFF